MSDNGVPVSGTDAQAVLRGLNRSDAKTAAALKVCQPVLGQGFGGQGGTRRPAERHAQQLAGRAIKLTGPVSRLTARAGRVVRLAPQT